jgi:hypothetical protein
MTPDSLIRSLQAFSRRRPFRSFLLQLMNSESLIVGHPEAWRAQGEVVLLTEPNGRMRLFDGWSVLQLIEILPGTTGDAGPQTPPGEPS